MDKKNLLRELTGEQFANILPVLLADDSTLVNESNCYAVFEPCSFTISDRLSGFVPLNDNEKEFSIWLKSIIVDFAQRYSGGDMKRMAALDGLADSVYENVMFLIRSKYKGKTIADITWNQEFPDIVAKTFQFTIGLSFNVSLNSHRTFNQLAMSFIPLAIETMGVSDESPETILKLSIASGLSGLDLKGAVAAASEHAQLGIPMAHLISAPVSQEHILAYCDKIQKISSSSCPIFDYERFLSDLGTSEQLLWFTDDVIESMFDLLFIEKILSIYQSLSVVIIPKNGLHANDLAWQQLEKIIQFPLYRKSREFASTGRLKWSRHGPRMSTANLSKLDVEIVNLIKASDTAVIKGCRMHEMIQGGLCIPSYTAYVVARSFSEIVSGLDATKTPLLFFYSGSNEYSFYGFTVRRKDPIEMSDGRLVHPILSTTYDHFLRRNTMNAKELTNEYKRIIGHISLLPDREKGAAISEANDVAEKLIEMTRNTYNKMAGTYSTIRWEEPHDLDKQMWNKLMGYLHNHINDNTLKIDGKKPCLLDIGAGHGRDLKYAQNQLNLSATSIDNSDSFVKIVTNLENEGKLAPNSIRLGDMRDLSMFPDNTFDAIRHNATLLHMPVIAAGYMADKAISECYRVLKPSGILFVFVKQGEGVEVVDTGEGLGERFYQFYDADMLLSLLKRNGFKIIEIFNEYEKRGDKTIPWVAAFATKI